MQMKIFVAGGLYVAYDVDEIKEGDYLLLPDGRWFVVKCLGNPVGVNMKIEEINSAEGPIPSDARILKLEYHDRVN